MNRINRTALVALVPLVLMGTACSPGVMASGSANGSIGEIVALRPDADAIPTTIGQPVTPTTALPNLPAVPTTTPPTVPTPTVVSPTAAVPPSYIPLEDDTGMLSVEVPAVWADIDTRPFINDNGTLRPGISASTDLAAFDDDWDAPGLVYTAFQFQPDPNVLFGRYDYSETCTDGGIVPYSDEVFAGYVRTFTDCADVASQNYVIVANPAGSTITIVLVVQVVTPEDSVAYQHVLETFNVDPNVGMPTETVPPPTTTPLPTTPLPTSPAPTVPMPTAPVPLPTSPLLTTPPQTAPLPTSPQSTAPIPTAAVPTAPAPTASPSGGVPAGYQVVSDDTGRLSIQVPSSWVDVDGSSAVEDGVDVAAVSAAPNLQVFSETLDGPGLIIHETTYAADPATELAARALAGECTDGGIQPNPNPNFTGVYQSWLDCGGTQTDLHVLVANPVDGRQVTVVIVVQTLTRADEEALLTALASYSLNPSA